MPKLTAAPLFTKEFECTLDLDDYGSFITGITFTPQTSTVSVTAVDGTVYSETVTTGWQVQINYLQDWDSAKALGKYFYDNAGQTKALTFVPTAGGGSFDSNVSIGHGPIGGNAGQHAASAVTFGCSKPIWTPGV